MPARFVSAVSIELRLVTDRRTQTDIEPWHRAVKMRRYRVEIKYRIVALGWFERVQFAVAIWTVEPRLVDERRR